MLRHQFGQNLILRLDLLLQIRDSFLFGLMVRTSWRLTKLRCEASGGIRWNSRLALSQARTSSSTNLQYFPRPMPGIRSRHLSRVCSYTHDGGTFRIRATSRTVRSVPSRTVLFMGASIRRSNWKTLVLRFTVVIAVGNRGSSPSHGRHAQVGKSLGHG
jgi:hypothetical protein